MNFFVQFLETLKNIGLEFYGRYYSLYPGIVVDNKDPEKRGRIKVKMPSILNGETLVQWAVPMGANLAGKGTGSFFPPYIGDVVDVMFEHGDLDFPVYVGGFWATAELPEAFKNGYPNVKGWVFKSGQKILVSEVSGKTQVSILNGENGAFFVMDDTAGKEAIYLTHKLGSTIQIQKNGSITLATYDGGMLFINTEKKETTLKSADGTFFTVGKKMAFADSSGKQIISFTDKTIEITASEDVILTAKNVNVNAGTVTLGKGADDHAAIYEKVADIFDNHVHLTVMGPSDKPFIPNTFALTENIPTKSAKARYVKVKSGL